MKNEFRSGLMDPNVPIQEKAILLSLRMIGKKSMFAKDLAIVKLWRVRPAL